MLIIIKKTANISTMCEEEGVKCDVISVSRMNTNVIRPISQLGSKNQKQNLRKKHAKFLRFQGKAKIVSKYKKRILEPIVEISTESQVFNEYVAETTRYQPSKENNDGSVKEKCVFVIVKNEATAEDNALRVDVESATPSRGNVKVKDTISEVVANLRDKQNIDLSSSEIDHEYLWVMNDDVDPASSQITRPFNKKKSRSPKPVSKYLEEPIISFEPESDYYYKTESTLAASEDPFYDNQQQSSDKCDGDIPEDDDYYILVLDSECNAKGSDESDAGQQNESNDCSDCTEEFDDKNGKKHYYCKKCDTYFKSLQLLMKHSRLKCCGSKSNIKRRSGKKMRKTMKGGKGTETEYQLVCENCNRLFKNKKTLKHHTSTVCRNKDDTSNIKSIVCDICGKVYYKTSQFRVHMQSHENLRTYKCSECKSGFNSRWFLKRHIAQVHRKCRYLYFCSYCGIKSESKEHIEMHEQVHTLPEGEEVPQPYECVCGKSFISKHAHRVHKYSCPKQGKMRVETSLKCPLCGKTLATALCLSVHMESKHHVHCTKGERAITCDQCDKRYAWFGSYVRHKLLEHQVEVKPSEVEPYVGSEEFPLPHRRLKKPRKESAGPHICGVCNKECSSESALRAHKWYHHSDKRKANEKLEENASCDLCQKTFRHKSSLTTHIHRYHRPRDPSELTCHICNKQFNYYGGLWTHNKYVHIDELPFDCPICGTKFKRKGDKTRHLKDKHGIVKSKAGDEGQELEGEVIEDPGEDSTDFAASSFELLNYSE